VFRTIVLLMHLRMTSLKQDDVKNLFNREFNFVNNLLNQVKLPVRVEDSGTLVQTCAFSIKLI
jgi:hypothetical protein